MKNFIKNFFMICILLLLITIIIFFIKKFYKELLSEENLESIATLPNILEYEKYNDNIILVGISENIEKIENNKNEIYPIQDLNKNSIIKSNFFYYQLSDRQKIFYNGLYENKKKLKQGDYVIDFDDKFSDVLVKTNGNQILGADYQTAIEAFIHDNPDVFYIDVNKMFLNIETTTRLWNTTYKVYIGAKDGVKYYQNSFSNLNEIEQAIEEIEKEKNYVMNKLEGSDYKKIKYIHDYLIDNIDYDSSYNEIGTYDIYGALVKKKCVCEGYAKAFKYLANCAGLECELIQGVGINSTGSQENHEWNCIKLNGIWYYLDCTWDDPIVVGGNGKATQYMKYKYFLKGTNTFEKDHIVFNQFSEGGKVFENPSISEKDYYK